MKKKAVDRKVVRQGIDQGDRGSLRQYRKWQASRAYNDRVLRTGSLGVNSNRDARNAKKRQAIAALRAKQKLESPIVQAARVAAKEESTRKYREKNREMLARKALAARATARQAREIADQVARQDSISLAKTQRTALNYALWDPDGDLESDQEGE
ncbi:hypothetical protein K438DRAFT_1762532 [Mycena galopus ATCC 62051]|nr:hypothetical protein K438DRAFT_1762532 [Mycena galopus ATCC 62051]